MRFRNTQLLTGIAVILAVAGISWGQEPGIGIGGGSLEQLTRPLAGAAQRASSSHEDLEKNGDARSIDPGATLVLLDTEGPGIVTHIWNTVGTTDPFHGRNLVLRVYYDHANKPSVVAPLGDFFGIGHGAWRDLVSVPVTVTSAGRSRSCFWRMPFQKAIRITVTNDSDIKVDSFYYYVDWLKLESLPEDTLYFHALYRQEHPVQSDGHYLIADIQGRGQYVGTVLSAHQMETGWFGEGDDFFYVDGEALPRLRGTGTEDYFCDAWGFREFCAPWNGVPVYEGVITGDRVSAYRWHVQDPIPFQRSLRVEFEHRGSVYNDRGSLTDFEVGGFLNRRDWYSSVAFWYQAPPAALDDTLPPPAQRVAPYHIYKATDLTFRGDPPILILPADPAVLYAPGVAKAQLEFDLALEKDGRYRLDAVLYHTLMSGTWRVLLDDKPLGPTLDLNAAGADFRWVFLDTLDLKAGMHTLRFECVEESVNRIRALAPKFNLFGVAAISLLRLEDMEGFQQVLKEKTGKQ
ncbi:MAG TPA: DUF2961 domain-containing protein [Candidatus Hydrogenedentes bacterium]|nr:DUF2961 domain-containing protein [Candidatus Hydrogenedentota bacterium]